MKNDGGPAFPHTLDMTAGGNERGGMTLRDYFAAKAMQSIIQMGYAAVPGRSVKLAAWSYEFADAMILERSK